MRKPRPSKAKLPTAKLTVAPKSRGTHDTIKRARVKFADKRLIMVSWPEGDGSEA